MDEGIFPIVHDGGIVKPGESRSQLPESGTEDTLYERKEPRRSAAGPWQRPPGRTWASGRETSTGPGSTCSTASQFGELELSDETVADLAGAAGAYPQVQFRPTPDLIWLLNEIIPIRGLNESALLITVYPLATTEDIISWAWWGPAMLWIGPRHTNYYASGSICAYEPTDGTWSRRRPLTNLLDLQVVWIVRHLFLRYFGHWPGPQALHTPWERLREILPGESCGGCTSGRRYEDCCRPRDERIDPIEQLMRFNMRITGNPERRPPRVVSEFVYGYRRDPPWLANLNLRPPQKVPALFWR